MLAYCSTKCFTGVKELQLHLTNSVTNITDSRQNRVGVFSARDSALRPVYLLHCTGLLFNYTPGIYADGYIVFAFPFVCSFVR